MSELPLPSVARSNIVKQSDRCRHSYGCNVFPGGGKKNSEFNKFVEALEWVLGINAGVK